MEEVIEKYDVIADGITVEIGILGGKGRLSKYKIKLPDFSAPTLALLDEVKHELLIEVSISTTEILDPKAIIELKEKFRKKAIALLEKHIPGIKEESKRYLAGRLMQEMLGLGKIEFLLNGINLEEIVINSIQEPIRVYHKTYGWLLTDLVVETEAQIQNYSNIIARRVGRQINTLNPLLDAHLVTGDRANAVLYPIANKGNTITIRKFSRDPWTVTDLIKNNTVNSEIMALIWLAMEYEMNILISGGTASGKTSLLNVCLPFIPPNHRILTIEDTRELVLPKFLYWCPLVTRQPNPEGKGEVTMLDLLINSLRMRPDRIILGEIRRGLRRVYQVGEYLTSESELVSEIKPNILYRWDPAKDKIVIHQTSRRLFEDLTRHTGLSLTELNKNLAFKTNILGWMVKNNIRNIDEVGHVMNEYYLDSATIEKLVRGNKKPKELLK